MNNDLLIRLSGIGMRHDYRTVLSDVNLDINRGDFLAITGPNGGGKTTLLRIILKLLRPTTGSVEYFSNGEACKNLRIGYLPQKNALDSRFPMTVRDVVSSGLLGVKGLGKEEIEKLTVSQLDAVEMALRADSAIGRLSGGQLQRVLLARALVANPEILVLDEPLSYLDKHFEHRVYEILRSLRPATTIVLVSHEMSHIDAMATRHIIVERTVTNCNSCSHAVHYDCEPEGHADF